MDAVANNIDSVVQNAQDAAEAAAHTVEAAVHNMDALLNCGLCPVVLDELNACPMWSPTDTTANYLQIAYVFISLTPYAIFTLLLISALDVNIFPPRRASRSVEVIPVANFHIQYYRAPAFSFACLLLSYGACSTLKAFLKDPRPYGACSTSFGNPSNHSAFAATLSLLILFYKWRANHLWKLLALAYPVLCGIARVEQRYHHPYQVGYGLLFGLILGLLLLYGEMRLTGRKWGQ